MKRPKIKNYTKAEIPNNMEDEIAFKILDLRKEVANEQFSDSNQTEKPKNPYLGKNYVMLQVVADEHFSDPSQEIALSEALKSKSNVEIGDWLFKVDGQISPYLIIRHKNQGLEKNNTQTQWIKQIKDESSSPTVKINGFLSKKEICLKKGWTDFTFRFLRLSPDKSVNEMPYYKEETINEKEMSPRFKQYLETIQNVEEMLRWVDITNMTKWEFLDAVVFTIPEMPEEALIIYACDSFNDLVVNDPSYEGFEIDGEWYGPTYADPENDDEKRLAKICLDYLRHKHTPYNSLLYRFCKLGDPECDEFHDELKNKVNTAIYKVYPWIRMKIGSSY